MKTALLLLILSVTSLAHADILDDKADAGGQMLEQQRALYSQAYSVHNRYCAMDSTETKNYPNCDASEKVYRQQVADLQKKVDAMVPTHTPIKFTRDQMSLSTDDLMYELMDRKQNLLETQKDLDSCLANNNGKAASCTDTQKYLDFYKKTYGEVKANLLKKGGLEAFTDKRPAQSLDEMAGLTVKQARLSEFQYGPYDPKSKSTSFRDGSCEFEVSGLPNADAYAAMYMSNEPADWKVGEYHQADPIDAEAPGETYEHALVECQALRAELRGACTQTIKFHSSFHVPGFVTMTSDSGKTLKVYSSAEDSKKGVFTCLADNMFEFPQVAKTAQATDKQTASTSIPATGTTATSR